MKINLKTPSSNYGKAKPVPQKGTSRAVSALKAVKANNKTNNDIRKERTHLRCNSGNVSGILKAKNVEEEVNAGGCDKPIPVNKLIGTLKDLVTNKNQIADMQPQTTKGRSKPMLANANDPTQVNAMMQTAYQAYITKAIKEVNEEINKKLPAKKQVNATCPEHKEEICISGRFADSLENLVVGRQIGQGAYASVRVAFDKSLGCKVALKIYDKSKLVEPQRQKGVQREIKIMEKLNHPHVVKVYTSFDTKRHVVIEMENVKGTSLHGYLKAKEKRRLDEAEAKRIFRQVVNGVEYCHSKSIAHRDIKLENLLMDESNNVKIIDFGFSTCMSNSSKIKIFCGTPSYMSPEIVTRKEYAGPPADVWALGVLLYAMLCGSFPFKGSSDKELYKRITRGQFVFPEHLSSTSKALIVKILNIDADKRPTAHEIANDIWLNSFTADQPKQLSSRPSESPVRFVKPINPDALEAYHGALRDNKSKERRKPEIQPEYDYKNVILNNIAPGSTINNNFNIINNITHINCPPMPKADENDSLTAKSNASSLLSKNDYSARAKNPEVESVDYDLITSITKLGYQIEDVQKQLLNENSHIRALYDRLLQQKKKLNVAVCQPFIPSMMSYDRIKTPKANSSAVKINVANGNYGNIIEDENRGGISKETLITLNGTAPFVFGGKISAVTTPTSRGLFRPIFR